MGFVQRPRATLPRTETTAPTFVGLVLSPRQQLLGSPVAPDQVVGRAVVPEFALGSGLKFGDDARRERLPQFDPPLVKRVNAPNGTLSEYAVFVQCDELPQRHRSQPFQEDGARAVSYTHLRAHET